jgi:hypothetical protein
MVINDLNVVRITVFPGKADAPLLVYPDAVLAFPVMVQCFQMIGRWNPQSLKNARCIDHLEFDDCRTLYILRQFCGELSIKELFGFLAFEGFDHGSMLSRKDIIVKGYQEERESSSTNGAGDDRPGFIEGRSCLRILF